MKFSADKKILVTALGRIQSIAEKTSFKPITMLALIKAQGDSFLVAATNLQLGTKGTYQASSVHEEGEILVNARMIYEIIKEMPDGVIGIEEKDNYTIEISSGKKVKFKISGSSPDDFPMIIKKEKGADFIPMDRNKFLEMLDLSYFSMSRSEDTLNIHGTFIENIDGGLTRVVTTDGFRLSIVDEVFEETLPLQEGILVPYKGVIEIHKILHEKREEEKIYLRSDNKALYVRIGEIEYTISLIDKRFPDYRVIIPGDGYRKFETILSRDELLPALKRVGIIALENTNPVIFSFKDKELTISTEDSDLGMVRESIQLEKKEKEEITFCLNCRYMLDIVVAVQDDIILEYNLEERNKPIIIRPAGKKDRVKYIVMPMRMD